MPDQIDVFDITIIGGGPTGIFTAFYAGLRQASVKVIESLPDLGGQLTALYPEKYIYDIPGIPKIRGQQLIDNLTEQMNQFAPTICTGEVVMSVEKMTNNNFKIMTNQTVHFSKAIIITAGNGAFQPRKLNLEQEDLFASKNLYYAVTDIHDFKDKEVVIFGGGDSAVDWALMLEPIAEKVTVIHRREKFRAHEASVATMKNSKVSILTPFVPVELEGNARVDSVTIKQMKTNQYQSIKVDDVLVSYGFVSSLGPINNWGLMIKAGSIQVNSNLETNIKGIYAVGDINIYEGKVKLIATGFGEAPIAVSHAIVYIDPTNKLQAPYSTNIMEKVSTKKKKGVHMP